MNRSQKILDTLADLGRIPDAVFAYVHVETDPVVNGVKQVLKRKRRSKRRKK